jgi:hypothetical protein
VLAAVRQNGCALAFASDNLRADAAIVITAMRRNSQALLYATPDVKADQDVLLTASWQSMLKDPKPSANVVYSKYI